MNLNDYRNLGKAILPEEAGIRIDRHLGERFLFLSRNEWSKRLRKGEVFVNLVPVKSSYRLRPNDEICYLCPPSKEPEVNREIQVVWEKDGVIGVYKPPNLPMHEGGRYRKNTFYELVINEIGPEWAAVHRLDRETSGIVLCANTPELRNTLSKELRERTMEKTYYAIVHGIPKEQKFLVDEPLGETLETTFRVKNWVIPGGMPSQTHYELLETKGDYSLLKVSPKTGRTHQIRIHSSFLGHHLIGDKKYHPDESIYLEYLGHGFTDRVESAVKYDRLCLHATNLKFLHPLDNQLCEIDIPMPEDMQNIWEIVREKHSHGN